MTMERRVERMLNFLVKTDKNLGPEEDDAHKPEPVPLRERRVGVRRSGSGACG